MRIAITTEVFLPKIDGITNRLRHSIERLRRSGHEVLVIAPSGSVAEHAGARAGAEKVAAAIAGARFTIERTRALLEEKERLDELTRRQLEKILLTAAENPATLPDVVAA